MEKRSIIILFVLLNVEATLESNGKVESGAEVYSCKGVACMLKDIRVPAPGKKPRNNVTRIGVLGHKWCGHIDFRLPPLLEMVIQAARRLGPTKCILMTLGSFPLRMYWGHADVLALTIRTSKWTSMAFTYPIPQGDVVVIVKKLAPEQPSIFEAFELPVWGALTGVLYMFVLAFWASGRNIPYLETWRTFLTGAFAVVPNHPVLNGVSLLLSAFGVIMATAFCARFTSFLAVTREAYQPQTLEEIIDRVSTVHASPSFPREVQEFDAGHPARRLAEKYPSNRTWAIETLLGDVASSKKVAAVISYDEFLQYRTDTAWVDPHTHRSLVHLVPQPVMTQSYALFITRRRWPHLTKLDDIIKRFLESGIMSVLIRKAEERARNLGLSVQVDDTPPTEEPRALRLAALLQPLAVLAAGVSMATVAFVVELTLHRRL